MNAAPTKLPGAVIVGLVLAVVLDTFVQITWKMSVADLPANAPFAAVVAGAMATPLFYLAMLAFGAQLFNWMRVLARADLSFAQPFTALSYILVLAISGHSLHEHISATRIAGVVLILGGVFLISRTPYLTAPTSGASGETSD